MLEKFNLLYSPQLFEMTICPSVAIVANVADVETITWFMSTATAGGDDAITSISTVSESTAIARFRSDSFATATTSRADYCGRHRQWFLAYNTQPAKAMGKAFLMERMFVVDVGVEITDEINTVASNSNVLIISPSVILIVVGFLVVVIVTVSLSCSPCP